MATEVDDVTTQYRFIHTASSFVFCICVSASKMAATDSYFWFFIYYSVHKHSLKPRLTQNDNTMGCFILPTFPEKITTERLRLTLCERNL